MALPKVNVTVEGGQLGRVALSADKVAALVLSGVAVNPTLTLNTAYQVFTLAEAEALGIDADYDTDNDTNAHAHIKAFYEEAGNGAELWIVVTAATQTLTQNVGQATALSQAANKPLLIGITRRPADLYTPNIVAGMDDDVPAAIVAAKTAAPDFATSYKNVHFLIEGRSLDDSALASLLVDNRTTSNSAGSKYVSVVLGDSVSASGHAMVGRVLGALAKLPVQRSLTRVRNGALSIAVAYLDATSVANLTEAQLGGLYDKGYIVPRKHVGKDGIYLAGDPTCDPITSDFAFINRVRTIEKARRLAYGVLLEELGEEVPTDTATGFLKPAYAVDLRRKVENALTLAMVNTGEASAVSCEIDLSQNILATDTVEAVVKVQPVGTALTLEAPVSFTNPANV